MIGQGIREDKDEMIIMQQYTLDATINKGYWSPEKLNSVRPSEGRTFRGSIFLLAFAQKHITQDTSKGYRDDAIPSTAVTIYLNVGLSGLVSWPRSCATMATANVTGIAMAAGPYSTFGVNMRCAI